MTELLEKTDVVKWDAELDGAILADIASKVAESDVAVESNATVEPVVIVNSQPSTKRVPSARMQRERMQLVHRVVRLAIQVAFFVFTPALFSGAFGAVKYLCAQNGATEPIQATAFVVLLVALLAFTIVFGRFFCGYACAFGTVGDVLYAVFDFIRTKAGLPRLCFPQSLVRTLSFLKYVVLVGICIACFLGVWGAYSGYSPWTAFGGILAGSFDGIDPVALAILGVIAVCMIVRERFFCQFLCPLGAVFALMPVLGFSDYTRTRGHCARRCGCCLEACPVDIWPDADTLEHGECISCGRCADACPMGNVNLVAIERAASRQERMETQDVVEEAGRDGVANAAGKTNAANAEERLQSRPLRKTRESWFLWRGSGIAYMLVKAVLFLVVCWTVGATRYIPPFSEVVGQLPWLM